MKTGALKFVRRLLVLVLIVVTTIAAISLDCDFDNNACEAVSIVADLQMNAGGTTDKSPPSRAKTGHDTVGPDRSDGPSDASWMTAWLPGLVQSDVPDGPSGAVWYARQVALDPASRAAKVPNPPPKI